MNTVKQQARQLVEELPDDATYDDLMYQVYVRQKVEAGLQAVAEGQTQDHEAVKRRFFDR